MANIAAIEAGSDIAGKTTIVTINTTMVFILVWEKLREESIGSAMTVMDCGTANADNMQIWGSTVGAPHRGTRKWICKQARECRGPHLILD